MEFLFFNMTVEYRRASEVIYLHHVTLYTLSERGQDDAWLFWLQKKHSPQSMLAWLILFSYLFLLALPFGIRVQLHAIHVISYVIFCKHAN